MALRCISGDRDVFSCLRAGRRCRGRGSSSFSKKKGVFVRVRLPLFTNHCILDSVYGLLLQRDEDTAVRLLHPFTGDIVELPWLTTLVSQKPEGGVWPLELVVMRHISTCASFVSGTVTVLLTFNVFDYVAVATSLDTQWTMLSWTCPGSYINGPLPLHGKIYAVPDFITPRNGAPRIFEMDVCHYQDPPKLIFTGPIEKQHLHSCHLVEYGSEILVVAHDDAQLSHITVYRLADLILGKFIPLTNIGENTIFMGPRSICVSSRAFPMVKANTIVYFRPQKHRFAQYDISARTWSLAMDQCSINGLAQGPRSIICHILTCCSHQHWNKGEDYTYNETGGPSPKWKVKEEFRAGSYDVGLQLSYRTQPS
uniref:KIB1-4 beta-propeller domain-containing protein n=1 Tax=Aegilops tauschii TaxID=37682 RepID=M8BEI4_AEGTA